MKSFRTAFFLVFILTFAYASNATAQTTPSDVEHTEWIAKVLKDVRTIKIGMTRGEMRKVFGEEGGLSTTSRRTYVYLGSRYIKVDFEFEPRGPEIKDSDGEYRRPESDLDVIKKMSKPYLEFSRMD